MKINLYFSNHLDQSRDCQINAVCEDWDDKSHSQQVRYLFSLVEGRYSDGVVLSATFCYELFQEELMVQATMCTYDKIEGQYDGEIIHLTVSEIIDLIDETKDQ